MNYMMSHQAIMQKNKLLLKRVLPSLLYRRREQFATNDIILYVFFFFFFLGDNIPVVRCLAGNTRSGCFC